MELKISSKYPEEFALEIKPLLKEQLIANLDIGRVEYYQKRFKLNIVNILLLAISSMKYSKNAVNYVYTLNKTVRYKKYNLADLVQKITYGNLNMKGYPILEEVFRNSEKNISVLYDRWLDN